MSVLKLGVSYFILLLKFHAQFIMLSQSSATRLAQVRSRFLSCVTQALLQHYVNCDSRVISPSYEVLDTHDDVQQSRNQ